MLQRPSQASRFHPPPLICPFHSRTREEDLLHAGSQAGRRAGRQARQANKRRSKFSKAIVDASHGRLHRKGWRGVARVSRLSLASAWHASMPSPRKYLTQGSEGWYFTRYEMKGRVAFPTLPCLLASLPTPRIPMRNRAPVHASTGPGGRHASWPRRESNNRGGDRWMGGWVDGGRIGPSFFAAAIRDLPRRSHSFPSG